MIDIKLIRENPEVVKENIRKKFQDNKLVLVDEVLDFDKKNREAIQRADYLRSQRNKISKQIGALMGKGQKEEAEAAKAQVAAIKAELAEIEVKEEELQAEVRNRMLVIPNIIDDSVPVGKDDSENVELKRFGEARTPDFEVPYHLDILDGSPPCTSFSTAGLREKTWGKQKKFREGQKLQTLDDLLVALIGKVFDDGIGYLFAYLLGFGKFLASSRLYGIE